MGREGTDFPSLRNYRFFFFLFLVAGLAFVGLAFTGFLLGFSGTGLAFSFSGGAGVGAFLSLPTGIGGFFAASGGTGCLPCTTGFAAAGGAAGAATTTAFPLGPLFPLPFCGGTTAGTVAGAGVSAFAPRPRLTGGGGGGGGGGGSYGLRNFLISVPLPSFPSTLPNNMSPTTFYKTGTP